MSKWTKLNLLNQDVVNCRLCERLVSFRETLPARASYKNDPYWRKPVPGFGDPDAWLVIIGLAPSAHGGNRTGRIFTGDESGRFLFKALHQAGFANQPTSEYSDDHLILNECYITAAVKCVPPQNKPSQQETKNCSQYLNAELALLKNAASIIALGGHALLAFLSYAKRKGVSTSHTSFKHGNCYQLGDLPTLYCSYHPSPQNTYTGKLTEQMLVDLLHRIREERAV